MSIANTAAIIAARLRAVLTPQHGHQASYAVNTNRGTIAYATTATGAFRALRTIPAPDRSDAAIYDENGWCLYR